MISSPAALIALYKANCSCGSKRKKVGERSALIIRTSRVGTSEPSGPTITPHASSG
jgi:hypothetical protein